MTDLLRVLPDFPAGPYANLLPALETHGVSTSELLVLDPAEIGRRTQLPPDDVTRLRDAVLKSLHADLGSSQASAALPRRRRTITTLDAALDSVLGPGGIPTGYVTEVAGESGAGKTQFLLTLLLAVQLPLARGGLGARPAIYISTEAPLSTRRLSQMLAAHPALRDLPGTERPSMDRILSIVTPDLESQDHILSFQVPVEIARRNVGLLVIDSVAANYRAEFERGAVSASSAPSRRGASSASSHNMGERSADLVRLGMQLRELARKHDIAVVVANQVADRFGNDDGATTGRARTPSATAATLYQQQQQGSRLLRATQDVSPLARRGQGPDPPPMPALEPTSSLADLLPPDSSVPDMKPPPPVAPPPGSSPLPPAPPALLLDHQQRWFTGWGDDPDPAAGGGGGGGGGLKTPSLGLVWSTQIAARIVLIKKPVWGVGKRKHREDDGEDGASSSVPTIRSWRRWMKVVFAPYAAASGPGVEGGVEFEITMGGIKGVQDK
ncbi:hypothetical protein P8C59_006308 [Phyllachora maydis]|uniref:RecA family profile 1 domain-containing protein n=1 Tax=Phyllachora maydis TaxID=1825666 RepID=A0AAD9I6M1_9PEZI|nr:hypothetical protein P8C59_006308 [Phyllachora maydis]